MKKLTTAGFTLVELLVMAPIVMLTIVLLMSYLFNQYGQLTQQGALINLQVEAQSIVFSMQDDILLANGFGTSLNSGLSDSNQPSGGWTHATTPQTLITSTPALTANHRSPARQPVYINTEGCDPSVLQENAPLYNNIIYFPSGSNLYKRIVTAPSSTPTCGTSFQKQSCPVASATTDCPADRALTDKLHAFTLTYYDTNNTVVTDPTEANRVKVDLTLKDRAYAEDIYADSTITLKKLNR